MATKRVLSTHSVEVRHITNPHLSGGGITTKDIPFTYVSRLKELMEIGEAEVIFPNGWTVADGKKILTRNQFDKFDIIEIWRDKELDFSGLITQIGFFFSEIKLKLNSQIWLLTQQYTGNEEYIGDPSVIVPFFLKGWDYGFKDAFNRVSLGDDWTVLAGDVSIEDSKLKLAAGEGSPTQETFYSAPSSDGGMEASSTVWATVRDALAATSLYDALTDAPVAQARFLSPNYTIARGFFVFDTSALPDGATITAADLNIYINGLTNDNVASVYVVGNTQASNIALVAEDYDQVGAVSGGSKALSALVNNQRNSVDLNATGLSWISKTGYTKLALRMSQDFNNVAPTGDNYLRCYFADQAGQATYHPRLTVTYTVSNPPAVRRTATLSDWTQDFNLQFSLLPVSGVTQVVLRPNAAGDVTELSPSPAVANYLNVDEETSDGDDTFNYDPTSPGTGAKKDLYNLTACGLGASAQIKSITAFVRARSTSSLYVQSNSIRIKTGGQEIGGSSFNVAETYQNFSQTWETNPVTGIAWTIADLDALQAGVSFYSYTASQIRLTQLWVEVSVQIPIRIYFPWIDANNYLVLIFQNEVGEPTILRKVVSGATSWEIKYIESVPATVSIQATRKNGTVTIYVAGVKWIEKQDDGIFVDQAGYLRLDGLNTTGISAYYDDVILLVKKQLITEGTISFYGSQKTVSCSYETLYNAIDQRLRRQLTSTDDLATTWEWKETPLAFVNTTTPCASLDLLNRVGENKDLILSVKEKNVSDARTLFSFDKFKTNLIALGAGTTAIENAGQPLYEAANFDSYDEIGMILQTLYQLSDEADYDRLVSLATLWLGKYKDVQENIVVDPIDYEKKGFQVGDGYLIDIDELKTDPATYYRIESEKREYFPDGAEKITVNVKDQTRSFRRELLRFLRELTNKARTNQGTYISQNYRYETESVATTARTTKNKDVKFRDGIHSGVKKVNWNVYSQTPAAPWQLYVDNVDRTTELFGSATTTGDQNNIDLTKYMTSISDHTIEVYNADTETRTFASFGDVELFVK